MGDLSRWHGRRMRREAHRRARRRGWTPSRRRGSTDRLSPRVGLGEDGPVLRREPEQHGTPLQPLCRPLVSLAGLGLDRVDEADLDQGGDRAAHPGFREAERLDGRERPPIDWEGRQEPRGGAPEPRQELGEGEGGRGVLPPL